MSTTAPTHRSCTVEDTLAAKILTDAQVSPDGSAIAFTVSASYTDGAKSPKSNIWLAETSDTQARQFTAGPRADLAPRWSPDGQSLAFLSDRDEDGRFGIYLLARAGGEARRLVELQGTVSELQWSPDGSAIAFLMADPAGAEDQRRQPQNDDPIEFERDPKFQRAWIVDADGANPRLVSAGPVQVWELAWFPDGQALALICSDRPYEWSWYQAYVARVPAAGGMSRQSTAAGSR